MADIAYTRHRDWYRFWDFLMDNPKDSQASVHVKTCPTCGHTMELVTREREALVEPPMQWECLCGFHCATYSNKELGEI